MNLFSHSNNIVTEYYKSGEVRGTGSVDFHHIEYAYYRNGIWKEYYQTGQLKATGSYELSTYEHCCIVGPCELNYSYRSGPWIFYHENGQVYARGTYKQGRKHLDTTCKGGDDIDFGFITDEWEFFDNSGVLYSPTDSEISLLQQSGFIDESEMDKAHLFFSGHIPEEDFLPSNQKE